MSGPTIVSYAQRQNWKDKLFIVLESKKIKGHKRGKLNSAMVTYDQGKETYFFFNYHIIDHYLGTVSLNNK